VWGTQKRHEVSEFFRFTEAADGNVLLNGSLVLNRICSLSIRPGGTLFIVMPSFARSLDKPLAQA
jgi:hypothetical protein